MCWSFGWDPQLLSISFPARIDGGMGSRSWVVAVVAIDAAVVSDCVSYLYGYPCIMTIYELGWNQKDTDRNLARPDLCFEADKHFLKKSAWWADKRIRKRFKKKVRPMSGWADKRFWGKMHMHTHIYMCASILYANICEKYAIPVQKHVDVLLWR